MTSKHERFDRNLIRQYKRNPLPYCPFEDLLKDFNIKT